MFPALGNNLERRNGGVPQEGDLGRHLHEYKIAVDDLIPDVNNNGLAIIDFESWRPIYRQNFGSLAPYKDLSLQIERERHPFWTESRRKQEVSFILLSRNFDYLQLLNRRRIDLRQPVKDS